MSAAPESDLRQRVEALPVNTVIGSLAALVAAVHAADAEYRRVCDARLHAGAAQRATEQTRIALADALLEAIAKAATK